MAGWPFDDFALNPKCLAFSGALVAAYMYLPCKYDRNWPVSVAVIATASYVGLAWYDYAYDCNTKMRPGAISVVSKYFKPPLRNGVYGG